MAAPPSAGAIRKDGEKARHGTTTLFAALDNATGVVIHAHHRRHIHVEWLPFLQQVDRSVPEDVPLVIIADNYATHKHASATQRRRMSTPSRKSASRIPPASRRSRSPRARRPKANW